MPELLETLQAATNASVATRDYWLMGALAVAMVVLFGGIAVWLAFKLLMGEWLSKHWSGVVR